MEEKIYRRVARSLEDDILAGVIKEGEMIPSTNQYAEKFSINPATAAKGVSMLSSEGVLAKKRGIGMFVTPEARELILERRKKEFRETAVTDLFEEARKLGISKKDLIAIIMSM